MLHRVARLLIRPSGQRHPAAELTATNSDCLLATDAAGPAAA